jgi:hypothetical protein
MSDLSRASRASHLSHLSRVSTNISHVSRASTNTSHLSHLSRASYASTRASSSHVPDADIHALQDDISDMVDNIQATAEHSAALTRMMNAQYVQLRWFRFSRLRGFSGSS